jgi:hypothetical protein
LQGQVIASGIKPAQPAAQYQPIFMEIEMSIFKATVFVAVLALSTGASIAAEKTTIDHGNGEKTTVKSDGNGSKVERGNTVEHTRETHKEAVDRVKSDSQNRGEKATTSK